MMRSSRATPEVVTPCRQVQVNGQGRPVGRLRLVTRRIMTARASPPPPETSIVLARRNFGEAQVERLSVEESKRRWGTVLPIDDDSSSDGNA